MTIERRWGLWNTRKDMFINDRNLGEQEAIDAAKFYNKTHVDGIYEARSMPSLSADVFRDQGWTVAIHNDYMLKGEPHTFWLFTKGNLCVKGEGRTDNEAFEIVANEIKRIMSLP